MSEPKATITQKVSALISNLTWKKVLTFSFFLLIAVFLWGMRVYRSTEMFPIQRQIALKYVNTPTSVSFEKEFPPKLTVDIQENGAGLLKYFFARRVDTVTIDVTDFINNNKICILQEAALKNRLASVLQKTSVIKSVVPSAISFEHTELSKKTLEVIFDGQINCANDYMLNGDITVSPKEITAYGSKESLANLKYAYTQPDTLQQVATALNISIALQGVEGVRFVPSEVKVNIPVEQYTVKDISIPVRCINLPEDISIKLFPSAVHLQFRVGYSSFKSFTEKDFLVEIDYNDLKDNSLTKTPVRLIKKPDKIDISSISLTPPEVEFALEKKTVTLP